MRLFYFIGIFFLIFVTSCGTDLSSSDKSEFKFHDDRVQTEFIKALEKARIRVNIREDGTVLYSPKDEDKVRSIRAAVADSTFVPAVHYEDENLEKKFLEQLKAEQIKFVIEIKQGKRWISWSETDNSRVEKILAAH